MGAPVTGWEVGEGAVLEAVRAAAAGDGLLPHACHHLRDVDGRALAAALAHDQRRVVVLQRLHAHLHPPPSAIISISITNRLPLACLVPL